MPEAESLAAQRITQSNDFIRKTQDDKTLPKEKKAELIAVEVKKLAPIGKKFPKSPLVQDRLARAYLQAEDFTSSLVHAGNAVALARQRRDAKLLAEALESRSLGEWYAGNYPQAAKDALESLKLKPENPVTIAVYYLSKGRSGSAGRGPAGKAADLARHVRVSELLEYSSPLDDPEVIRLVKLYGAKKAAERLLQKAVRASKIGDPKAVLEAAGNALRFRPDSPDIYMMRGIARADLESLPAAIDELTIAVELWKERFKREQDAARLRELAGLMATALNIRSMLRERIEDYRGAFSDAEEILKLDPGSAGAYLARARAREGLGQSKKRVLADFKRAAELDQKHNGDYQAALERLRAAGPGESERQAAAAAGPGVDKGLRGAQGPAWRDLNVLLIVVLGLAVLGLIAGLILSVLSRRRDAAPAVPPEGAVEAERPKPPPSSADILAKSPYEKDRLLGEGGMGKVYEGKEKSSGRRVAIKVPKDELQGNQEILDRIEAEGRVYLEMGPHPHIVRLLDIVKDKESGLIFLVFEMVNGRTLGQVLALTPGRRMTLEAVLRTVEAVCAALAHAHARRVIHRDLKPSNIMIAEPGAVVKVMDFGIARVAKDSLLKISRGTAAGTPFYMAPEQASGQASRESDLYSLAICIYEMLTGSLPFQGSMPALAKEKGDFKALSALLPGAPKGLDAFFKKALAPKPADRFHAVDEFLEALKRAVSQVKA